MIPVVEPDFLGTELRNAESFGSASPGAKEQLALGNYRFRTIYGSQPAVLRPGDQLATGEKVCAWPRDPGDGVHILVNLDGIWERVPARFACAFYTSQPLPTIHEDFWGLSDEERRGGQMAFPFMEGKKQNA